MTDVAAGTTLSLPGIDAERVSPWLESVAGLRGPFRFDLVAGGRSNLTYAVTDADGRRVVLRRPPTGLVLESAHDVAREHRIISALGPTAVPVPPVLGLCTDLAVTGAPFYVMEFVDGVILRDERAVEAHVPVEDRHRLAESLIDAMADLHAVDPDAVGLGDLSRRDGFAERQLRRWHKQWTASRSRDIPAIAEGHRRLSARVPPQRRLGIVHGDFRLDNTVFRPDGSVSAVLDWELCTLGDPLADLGLLLTYWIAPDDDRAPALTGTPTRVEGFPDRRFLVDRYAARTGADVTPVGFWMALGYWKLACIAEGIHARYAAGVMGDDGLDPDVIARAAPLLAEEALRVLDA